MLSGEWLYYQSQCLLLINHIEELAAFFFLFFNLKISFIVFVYLFLYLIGNLNLGVRSICFSFFFFSLVNLGQSHYPKRIFILFWHRSFSPKDVLPLFFLFETSISSPSDLANIVRRWPLFTFLIWPHSSLEHID